ncbi:hypothetical protein K474DRAFT_1579044, partial [Panus rudis PR-1116 ss-1]
ILYYDWLLTLADEIRLYWCRRISFTFVAYFLNRYCNLLIHIPVVIETFVDLSTEVC